MLTWPERAIVDLAAGLVIAVALMVLVPTLVDRGDPAFTRSDRAFLAELYPGGVYDSDRLYRVCDSGSWMFINAHWDRWYATGRGCVRKP